MVTSSNSCGSLSVTQYDAGNEFGSSASNSLRPVSLWPNRSSAFSYASSGD